MIIRVFPKEPISTENPEKAEPRWNPDKKNSCFRKILTPENFNVFRGLNGGHDKDRTCDPYDVKGEICLFIEHYFCLLIVDKWLISAKNLYNSFLQT